MTTPFGMPTFVKVGKKKTPKQLSPPATPRPPTEGAQPSVGIDVTWYENQAPGYEHTMVSGVSPGDIIFVGVFSRGSTGTASSTTHSVDSFTKIAGQHDTTSDAVRLSVWKRIADGTEPGTVTVDQSGGTSVAMASMMWFVRANGIDYSTYTPDLVLNTAKNAHDPPAVSPSHGANDYFVFPIDGWHKADLDAAPSGYAFVSDDDPPTGKTDTARVSVAYAKVAITTSEDPGAFTASNTAGQEPLLGTLALLAEQDPEVSPFDHTHVEADVTDLDHWTEADHDALDHTGLTGVGGADADAIHDNVSGEIAAVTEKASPVSADLLLIEDSAASNAKKRVQIGNLPGGTSDHGALTGLSDDDHTQYLLAAGTRAATYLEVSGLTGATGSSPRFVGGTTSGAPASGTFALGDYVVTEDGNIYVCTTAGSPGTWTAVGAGAATDSDAIHDNVAGEIAALTLVTAASGDHVLIEDASDSNNKKRVAASDFLGGGGGGTATDWMSHLAAADDSPTAEDNFDDASIGTTNIATTGTVTWTEKRDLLSVKAAASSMTANDLDMQVYALPVGATSSPVTIEARGMFFSPTSSGGPRWFLGFTDGTTSAANIVGISVTQTSINKSAGTVTNVTSETNLGNTAQSTNMGWLYTRVVWVSSNTFQVQWSVDGISWSNSGLSSFATTITPTHYGVGVANWAFGEDTLATFEYLRVYASDLSV